MIRPDALPGSSPAGRVHISVVVPLYRCEECVPELHRRLTSTLETLTSSFEIVLVNDGSPQADWSVARALARRDRRVKAINLSRNFGQHYALTAGLDHAEGDWVVVMDGDLQDPPEEIPRLYAKALEGHGIVYGRKVTRIHSPIKRAGSRALTAVLGFLMGEKLDNAVTHFSIVSRDVVEALRRFKERNRSYAFLLRWVGFDVAYVDVEHHARYAGTGSYTFTKLVRLALEMVVSQTEKPLRLSIGFGFLCATASFLFGAGLVLRYLFWNRSVQGWTSVIVSMYFLGGLMFIALGLIGLYVGRIFEESKSRPLYLIKESVNVPAAFIQRYQPQPLDLPRTIAEDAETQTDQLIERHS